MASFKTVWWIARPSRDPMDFVQALEDLKNATNNFTDQWKYNRQTQKQLETNLGKSGSKRDHNSFSGSGGRTWTAWLREFGFIYYDDKHIVLTSVGQALLSGKNIHENIVKQLLCYQLANPETYKNGENSIFDATVSVHPHRFILEVCLDPRVEGYITKNEINLFCLPVMRDDKLNNAVEHIIAYRAGSLEFKRQQIENFENLDFRERSDKESRSFFKYCLDITNTILKHIEYTGLVNRDKSRNEKAGLYLKDDDGGQLRKLIDYYNDRYPFDDRYLQSESIYGERYGLDVSRYKSKVVTNSKVASPDSKSKRRVKKVLNQYPNLISEDRTEIIKILRQAGFSPEDAIKQALVFEDMQQNQVNELESGFVDSYINQSNAQEFERQTNRIFCAFGFETEFHPAEVDPQPAAGKRNVDILLRMPSKTVALVDSKNHRPVFTLDSGTSGKMGTDYVPGYEGFEGRHVKYFSYIVAKGISGEKNIEDIRNKAVRIDSNFSDLCGTIISADALLGLLNYVRLHEFGSDKTKECVVQLFESNQSYSTFAEIKYFLNL